MRHVGLLAAVFTALLALLAPTAGAAARDRDHDGLPDRWETKHKLSTKAKSANADSDRDRVDNGNEWREGTSPRDADSDGDRRRDGVEDADRDGLSNADEDATGHDPRDRDSDDDGLIDGRERAGVISSYKGGVLRINLAHGGKVTGAVSEDTEVECRVRRTLESKWLKTGQRKARTSARVGGAGMLVAQETDPEDEFDADYGAEDDPDGDFGSDDDFDREFDELDGLEDDFDSEFEDVDGLDENVEPGSGTCSPSRLKTGAKVQQAELELGPDGAVFVKIALVR
jgi:hypothetical protein